ncbi:MAG: hypothetical protein EBU27_04460 [Opitutae bacterium]|nr:hypothetical protein [Opitutae bacterium]
MSGIIGSLLLLG